MAEETPTGATARRPFVVVRTLLLALAGGGAFAAAGLPAGWLSGAIVVVAVAAVGGLRLDVPRLLMVPVYLAFGISVGSAVTPETLARIGQWPLTMAAMVAVVAVVMATVTLYLRRVHGWDLLSAFFASAPGALSQVMVSAAASQADLRRVATAQSVRLFILAAALPGLLALAGLTGPAGAGALPAAGLPHNLTEALLLVVPPVLAGLIAERFGVPTGLVVGSMVVSGALHALDLVHGSLPAPLLAFAFAAIGAVIGTRFAGTDLRLLGQLAAASLGAFALATGLALGAALALAALLDVPAGVLVLAFAPGGLDTMVVLSFALGLDPAFVAAHHLFRFLLIALALPLLARLVLKA